MGLKMLLVDDEPLARSRMRTLLADCKSPAAEVAGEAANAAQAMEQLRRQAFDGVLLDIHMPGADGLALAQLLRTLPDPPAVVFVTAYAEHAVTAFEALGPNRTRVTVTWAPHESDAKGEAAFDSARESMTGGFTGTFDKLAAYVKTLRG